LTYVDFVCYSLRGRKTAMRLATTTVVIMATVACGLPGDFDNERAKLEAYNDGPNRIAVEVSGSAYNVGPKGNVNFTIPIKVPKEAELPYYNPLSASQDVYVYVSVRVINHDTGVVTSPQSCPVGAKYLTRITYNTNGQFTCVALNGPR